MFKAAIFSLIVTYVAITACVAQDRNYDRYGGYKKIKGKSTGYFHIENKGDKWYLVTPDGYGFRGLGINHFSSKMADPEGVIKSLMKWGFNSGDYQGPKWMWELFPYLQGITLVEISNFYTAQQFQLKDVFSQEYLTWLEDNVKKLVEPEADNKMLIGYFWTDIPVWSGGKFGKDWIPFFKALGEDTPGRKVWEEWKKANPDAPEQNFTGVIARQVYSKAYEFTRKFDKNHLIFSDRYKETDIPEAVVREALPYIDALAIQPFSNTFDPAFYNNIYRMYKKPVYIADYVSSFATEKHPQTMTQIAKDPVTYVKLYREFISKAFSLPYMLGLNKCQYKDEVKPTYLKQGLIQENGEPYSTVAGIQKANEKALKNSYKLISN
jgi:hypothetical protein